MLTLEALRAKHGDALLLHYGTAAEPRLVVIDGGPSGVWGAALRPRLRALRAERIDDPDDPLDIRLMMVSHIDDDHIHGILDLTADLVERQQDHRPLPWRIATLWHNSFDDIVGDGADELVETGLAEVGAASVAALAADPVVPGLSRPAAVVLASVKQGRQLRNDAAVLGLPVNAPAGGLVVAEEGDDGPTTVDLGDGLELVVIGPPRHRVEDLQHRWDEELERLGLDQPPAVSPAEYLDGSVYNLASLVVLARAEGKTMLLTGDARGDDVLAGLHRAGLLDDDGTLHVDLLKLPHHGSDRNIETDFFRTVTADHYVVSGDGRHGNPEVATFQMLLAARGDDPFTLHMTFAPGELGHGYPVADLQALFDQAHQAGKPFEVKSPGAGEVSLTVTP